MFLGRMMLIDLRGKRNQNRKGIHINKFSLLMGSEVPCYGVGLSGICLLIIPFVF